jgi:hypothetical protein
MKLACAGECSGQTRSQGLPFQVDQYERKGRRGEREPEGDKGEEE